MMNSKNSSSRVVSLAMFALAALGSRPGLAAPEDYRFELARPAERGARGSTVIVSVVHVPTGRRVLAADVFRRENVFQEKSIPRISERTTALVPDGQGNYRLTTYYPLSGEIKLGARVPGETRTVRGAVRLDATP